MKAIQLLENFSPSEAKKAADFGFLEWLFLLVQLGAVVILLGVLAQVFQLEYVGAVLEVISQSPSANTLVPILPLILLLAMHLGAGTLLLFWRKRIAYSILLGWLAGMALYSIVELVFRDFSTHLIYNLIGAGLYTFWTVYFFASIKAKVRFFYNDVFNLAVHTVTCPRCQNEVVLDDEQCGDSLDEAERFNALCASISSVKIPVHVRVAQIELLTERFGEDEKLGPLIHSFLKESYDKQMASEFRVTAIVSALSRALLLYRDKEQ